MSQCGQVTGESTLHAHPYISSFLFLKAVVVSANTGARKELQEGELFTLVRCDVLLISGRIPWTSCSEVQTTASRIFFLELSKWNK